MEDKIYDVVVIGGGLAGLSTALILAKENYSVLLLEKEMYPYHKVCGEYISMESWDFLIRMGVPLATMNLPKITKLWVSAPNGNSLQQKLPLGGFGISRFLLDDTLCKLAIEQGVTVIQQSKVTDVIYKTSTFEIEAGTGKYFGRLCCGSYGKRSNLDSKWKRPFIFEQKNRLNNFIGIKYHIHSSFANDTIALHNFKDGYCGISKIEDEKHCLCYLTTAANLKKANNNIEAMEQTILAKNKHLKEVFLDKQNIYAAPLAISQISFSKKTKVENHVLMLGDAAGLITPLCGNGMSMAMHSAVIAAQAMQAFLKNNIDRDHMEIQYQKNWDKQFSARLRVGRLIQSFFGQNTTTNILISLLQKSPWLAKAIIKKTHGKPF